MSGGNSAGHGVARASVRGSEAAHATQIIEVFYYVTME